MSTNAKYIRKISKLATKQTPQIFLVVLIINICYYSFRKNLVISWKR